jgi:uncharacterized protein with NRDE domain
MCTLIVFHHCFADAELVIAANRDEYLDRPAEPPSLHRWHGRRVLAPRDLRAGGTWLGTNDAGVLAGLTNRPTQAPDPSRRSRGLLVADALAAESAGEAAASLVQLAPRAYNPFNLLVCDAREAFVVVYEEKPALRRLSAGPHVIGNGDPDSRGLPKVARLLDEAEAIARGSADAALSALEGVCATHLSGGSPLEATCIHAGAYGTRSTTLLRRGRRPEQDWLRFSDGPPCSHAYRDFTPLLAQLDRTGRRAEAAERKHA